MPLSRQNSLVLGAVIVSMLACGQTPSENSLPIETPLDTVPLTPPMPWPKPAPLEARLGDLVITAVTVADSSVALKGAVRYTTTATVKNTASTARTVQLGDCPLWISVHESGGWYGQEGRPLEWDQLASGYGCRLQPGPFTFEAGQTIRMATSIFAHDLLAARVRANYRSFFHAHLRIDTAEVIVQADTAFITYPSSDLVPSATSVLAQRDTTRTLRTTVKLTNRGELPAYLEYGACATRVLAYRSPIDAVPAWDSDRRRMWDFGQPFGCVLSLTVRTIQAGDAFSPGALEVPLMEVVGDSLPDGHYYFRATVSFANRVPVFDIEAGDAEIVFARPPLSTTRRSFIREWQASPVALSGSSVRAAIRGTVVNGSGAVSASRDCPVLIRVYRDRARRDAAPRSGAPDWSQPRCGSAKQTTNVKPGETQTYETVVPVRDILGASLPSGRYYFAVLATVDGMEITLSAGEVDLKR